MQYYILIQSWQVNVIYGKWLKMGYEVKLEKGSLSQLGLRHPQYS